MKPLRSYAKITRRQLFMVLAILVVIAIAASTHRRQARYNATAIDVQLKGARVDFHPATFPILHNYVGNFFYDLKTVDFSLEKYGDETKYTEQDLRRLAELPRLERLRLDLTRTSIEGIRHLAKMKRLRSLSLQRCKIDGVRRNDLVDALLQLKRLEEINVVECGLQGNQLRNLAKLPKLTSLEFASEYNGSFDDDFMQPADAKALAKIKAKPIGPQILSEFDDASIHDFMQFDLAETDDLEIRASVLTRVGIGEIKQHPWRRLKFANCKLDAQSLSALDWEKPEIEFWQPSFTATELTSSIGTHATSMTLGVKAITFDGTTDRPRLIASYPHSLDEFTPELFRPLAKLETITLSHDHLKAAIEFLQSQDRDIKLQIRWSKIDLQPLWDEIATATQLTNLQVIASTSPVSVGVPKFTTEHQLKRLQIDWDNPEVNDEIRNELRKLRHLESLQIRDGRGGQFGLDQLRIDE